MRRYKYSSSFTAGKIIHNGLVVLGLFASALLAQPAMASGAKTFNITNGTITFQNHDWYQVQNAQTLATLCEGFENCVVPQGKYNIINLSKHIRFDNIFIEGQPNPNDAVDGYIRFNSPGWHQVQDPSTYATICEGFQGCKVSPGTYIVINLDTGHRSTVVIPGSNPGGGGDITVSGNTITWSQPGWYQVQNAHTLATICEGGTSCTVSSSGKYIVINLTTGRRWENISINGGGGGDPIDPLTSQITVEGNTIVMPGNAWYQVQNKFDLSTLCEGVTHCTVPSGTYTVINLTTGQREEFVIGASVSADNALKLLTQAIEVYMFDAYDSRLFADFNTNGINLITADPTGLPGSGTYLCANDGVATLLRRASANVSQSIYDTWTYGSCTVETETRNGEVKRFYTPGQASDYTYNFKNYKTDIFPFGSLEVTGQFIGGFGDPQNLSSSSENYLQTNLRPIDYEITYQGKTLKVLEANSTYRRLRPSPETGDAYSQKLIGAFRMKPTFSKEIYRVNGSLFGSSLTNSSPVIFDVGGLAVVSDVDDSYVQLIPNTGDINTAIVRVLNSRDAIQSEVTYRWSDLPFYDLFLKY